MKHDQAQPTTTAQTHQETLRLLLNGDTSPPLYAHEADAIEAAIAALDNADRYRNWRKAVGYE